LQVVTDGVFTRELLPGNSHCPLSAVPNVTIELVFVLLFSKIFYQGWCCQVSCYKTFSVPKVNVVISCMVVSLNYLAQARLEVGNFLFILVLQFLLDMSEVLISLQASYNGQWD